MGRVYNCWDTISKGHCTLKNVQKTFLDSKACLQLRHEIEIQTFLDHENILRCYGFFHDPSRIYVILDLALGGSVAQFLKKQPRKRLDEKSAANFLQQVDIKSDNLLLDKDGKVKIADFGCVVQNKNEGVGQITITICGSLNYIAPEMVKCAPHNKKVDNWAGVLLFEFLVECLTFEAEEE